MTTAAGTVPLKRTPLYDLHVSLGAKMVPFAGYDMPVQYPLGVLKEHLWTREKCGLFDVSHMGQAALVAEDGKFETVALAFEALVPADIASLAIGQQRYTQFTNGDGGILDDLMVTRPKAPNAEGALSIIVNAACKEADFAYLQSRLPKGIRFFEMPDRALIALQGPASAHVMAQLAPKTQVMRFMHASSAELGPFDCHISRSGYTGEDGFEISIPAAHALEACELLLAHPDVQPIGLGARDSLRLEAGLCLYGHDIDTTTSPVEAGLTWSIQKRRRLEGGFPGAARVQRELKDGPARLRIGLKPEGRGIAREGAEIVSASGEKIGVVTSGGFGPSVDGPVAMGYVAATYAGVGTKVQLMVRGKPLAAMIVALPFAAHRYARK